MSSKTLFLLSTIYPFQGAEPFLEDELRVYAKQFGKVIIINTHLSTSTDKKPVYFLPDNASIISIAEKISKPSISDTFKLLLDRELGRELYFLLSEKMQLPTISILKVLLVSLFRAKQIAKALQNIKD